MDGVYEHTGGARPRPVEAVLRSVVLVFRVLAFVWMAGLVTATVLTDDGVSLPWVWAALAVAAMTTIGTWWAAQRRERLASWWWIALDGSAAFFIGISPGLAGAEDLFYGGMPLSWLLLVVYAHSSLVVGAAAVGLLTITQFVIAALDPDPLSATEYVGRIAVWVVSALAYGWAMWALRRYEQLRLAVEEERDREQIRRRISDERAEIAAQLHDSVLQTLAVLQRDASDAEMVRTVARRQSVDLRNLIDRIASPFANGIKAALRTAAAEVEERYGIEVTTAFVGDRELDDATSIMTSAAREALVNAARHSGASDIALLCEVGRDAVVVTVSDRGTGFDPDSVRSDGGLARSVVGRMQRIGGSGRVVTRAGVGTEVVLALPIGRDDHDG